MKWEDVVRKLTSRKFWLAVVGFVTPLMLAMGYGESATEKACAIIMAGGTLIAYIIGEGLVDSARAEQQEEGGGQVISFINPDGLTEEEEEKE